MDNSQIEQDKLRHAVSQLGNGVAAAASLSRTLPLSLLREIEKACDKSQKNTDFFRHWAALGEPLLERIRTSVLAGKIDLNGDIDGLYGRTLQELAKFSDAIRTSIHNAKEDERLDGMSHRNDLIEAFSLCLEAVNDLSDIVTQIRSAIAQHDSAVSEIELSQEELEHVQQCIQNPKAPTRSMADSVSKLQTLLKNRTSLSH